MLGSVKLKNYGPLEELEWNNLGTINLIIGENGAGKTFLLKALYASVKALEASRGDEYKNLSELLVEKLYWTFQAEKIGDLVTKSKEEALSFLMLLDDEKLFFEFGKDTSKQISFVENHCRPRPNINSIFLPAKEILSLHGIILKSREQDKVFGFDDTYYDLASALKILPSKGRNIQEFSESRQQLHTLLQGRVESDEKVLSWHFRRGNQKFPMGITAEGIKKIAILDRLIGNRYLGKDSIVFIDEPEAALHPKAISRFLDIIYALSTRGIQFFMASHSYFVIKKLYLIAQKEKVSIPCLSINGASNSVSSNLLQEMPENPIIEESIRLYKEEIGV